MAGTFNSAALLGGKKHTQDQQLQLTNKTRPAAPRFIIALSGPAFNLNIHAGMGGEGPYYSKGVGVVRDDAAL